MKINSNNVSQPSVNSAQQLANATPGQRDDQAVDASSATDAFTPSAEWLRMLDKVKQEPDVRPDRIQLAAERLKNGDYFSSASADATANAMVNALD